MSLTTIRVSEADFNPGEEIERLIESSPEAGGVHMASHLLLSLTGTWAGWTAVRSL